MGEDSLQSNEGIVKESCIAPFSAIIIIIIIITLLLKAAHGSARLPD